MDSKKCGDILKNSYEQLWMKHMRDLIKMLMRFNLWFSGIHQALNCSKRAERERDKEAEREKSRIKCFKIKFLIKDFVNYCLPFF